MIDAVCGNRVEYKQYVYKRQSLYTLQQVVRIVTTGLQTFECAVDVLCGSCTGLWGQMQLAKFPSVRPITISDRFLCLLVSYQDPTRRIRAIY